MRWFLFWWLWVQVFVLTRAIIYRDKTPSDRGNSVVAVVLNAVLGLWVYFWSGLF